MPPLTTDPLVLGRVQRAWLEWLHDHPLTWPPLPASSLACPSRGSISVEQFNDGIATDGSRRAHERVQATLADYRYVTYVVDSEFVVLSDARPRHGTGLRPRQCAARSPRRRHREHQRPQVGERSLEMARL